MAPNTPTKRPTSRRGPKPGYRQTTEHIARRMQWRTETAEQRFDRQTIPVTESGCVLWVGTTNQKGYGRFWCDQKKALVSAHRFAYERERGPIPEGLTIDHLCRVTGCVRVEHLEVVDNRTNVLRGDNPPARHARQTHCKWGHPLDIENTRTTSGGRVCRRCEQQRKNLGRKVYVCHPYCGLGRPGEREQNLRSITEICRRIASTGILPVSPVHAFAWLDDHKPKERAIAIDLGLALLEACDEIRVYGHYWESQGCQGEIAAARALQKRVRFFSKPPLQVCETPDGHV